MYVLYVFVLMMLNRDWGEKMGIWNRGARVTFSFWQKYKTEGSRSAS